MFPSNSQELLIRRLARDLKPVRRLVSPGWQVVIWLGALLALTTPLVLRCDPTVTAHQLTRTPEICVGAIGSLLTALLGGAAALVLSRPDRRSSWALLPIPAATLWIVSGAIACLRHEAFSTSNGCFFSILGLAIPPSILLMALLRCGYSLRPNSTSALCGLASAAAAATISNVIHPHEAGASHLAVHGLAVSVIVVSNRVLGCWVLDTKK
jgi:hypothetical protein